MRWFKQNKKKSLILTSFLILIILLVMEIRSFNRFTDLYYIAQLLDGETTLSDIASVEISLELREVADGRLRMSGSLPWRMQIFGRYHFISFDFTDDVLISISISGRRSTLINNFRDLEVLNFAYDLGIDIQTANVTDGIYSVTFRNRD